MKAMLLILAAFALPAQAGLMCDPRYQDNTLANLGCELGSTQNDQLGDPLQVNTDLMFGFDDWQYAWSSDSGEALPGGLISFNVLDDNLGGAFTISWGTNPGDVLFTLKDGLDDPDTYVGWLLDPGALGEQLYVFESPFLNTTSGNLKEISHARFYYRAGGPTRQCIGPNGCNQQNVPTPGPLALMGAGLIAAGLVARKKKA